MTAGLSCTVYRVRFEYQLQVLTVSWPGLAVVGMERVQMVLFRSLGDFFWLPSIDNQT